ncbi:MAG: ABC transporter ATP-binding protein [Cyanobacteria bacterium J06638_7]
MSPGPVLLVEGLTHSWPGGRAAALKDCRLQLTQPGLWMLVGSNGSGKSTLLRLIAGLLPLQQGRIDCALRCALVFQNPDHQLLLPSCASEVLLGIDAALDPPARQLRLERALEQVGLAGLEDRPIHALSGGQKQRLAIAAALAGEAGLLLLDEPTALLDPDSQREVLELIRRLTRRGDQPLTALWITHRLEELSSCDGAALMRRGRAGPWRAGPSLAAELAS